MKKRNERAIEQLLKKAGVLVSSLSEISPRTNEETRKMKKILIYLVGVLMCCTPGVANLQTASVFTDNMVLQRGKTVPVWGTGNVGESVSVSFDGQVKLTTVDGDGKWRVDFDPLLANAAEQQLVVDGASNTITLNGVLVGDVWLASGQSNMKATLRGTQDNGIFVTNATNNLIRFLHIPIVSSTQPQDSFSASWQVSSSEMVVSLSAIAVIFSQRVQPETGVPLGMVIAAVGGTPVGSWVSTETYAAPPFAETKAYWDTLLANWDADKLGLLQDRLDRYLTIPDTAAAYDIQHPSTGRGFPAGCYNGMIHPLFPFSLKGFLWRQGEANWKRGEQYRHLMPFMIDEWRTNFEQPGLPFIQAQLPQVRAIVPLPGDSYVAELRESQYILTQTQTNVDMAVLIDTNADGALHPPNKQLAGGRMAALALAKVYHQAVPHQGPLYSGMQISNNTIRLSFDYLYGGLIVGNRETLTSLVVSNTPNALITNFSVAGSDQVFHWATAMIEGTNIVVSAPEVSNPMAARYAWANNPHGCNLYNDEGFPAVPFRTDNWPLSTLGEVEPGIPSFSYIDGEVLEVQTVGSGLVTRTPTTAYPYFESGVYGVYRSGTSVELVADPDIIWQFMGWSGDATGSSTNISVVVNSEKSVTATFVEDGNDPPTFNSDPVVEVDAIEGMDYSATLADNASDLNSDSLNFSLLPGGSAWLSVSTNGVLSGIPGSGDVGTNTWTVQVNDGNGGTNQASLKIEVIAAGLVHHGLFGPIDDSFVNIGSPDINRGGRLYLLIRSEGSTSHDRRGFMKFDLSNLQGTVTSAKLKLYSESIDEEVFVRALSDNGWSESTLTWNNAPWASVGTTIIASGIASVDSWFEIDLTDSITNAGLYSFTLEILGGFNGSYLTSSEAATNTPILEITTVTGGGSTNPPPVSEIVPINFGSDIVLQWAGVSGQTYTILSATNLLSGEWSTNRIDIPAIEPLNSATISVDSVQGFYKIEVN